jgi:hypothetical protein
LGAPPIAFELLEQARGLLVERGIKLAVNVLPD